MSYLITLFCIVSIISKVFGNLSGCADGEREWFLDQEKHPLIAGCSGAFQESGVKSQKTETNQAITCARRGGDDGPLPNGEGCSPADLCANGWHLCDSAVEVAALSGTGDCDNEGHSGVDVDLFFATGQSSNGAWLCTDDGVDDMYGCGSQMELDDQDIIFGSASNNLMVWLDANKYSFPVSGQAWLDRSKRKIDFWGRKGCCVWELPSVVDTDGSFYMDMSNDHFILRAGIHRPDRANHNTFPYPYSGTYTFFFVARLVSNPLGRLATFLGFPSTIHSYITSPFIGLESNHDIVCNMNKRGKLFTATPEMYSEFNLYEFTVSTSFPFCSGSINNHIFASTNEPTNALPRALYSIGAGVGLTSHQFREILIFDRALTFREKDIVSSFLMRKWNLGSNRRLESCKSCRCGALDKLLTSAASSTGTWFSALPNLEAMSIQKRGSAFGGVLCCRDTPCLSCNNPENQICKPRNSGCSDGSREWFVDQAKYPDIAGCAGGFDRPGLLSTDNSPIFPTCSRQAGNDGSTELGCSSSDLCEEGWEVCNDLQAFLASSGGKFCDPSFHIHMDSNSFFASAMTQDHLLQNCESEVPLANTLVGCGGLGSGSYCRLHGEIAFHSANLCSSLSPEWNCSAASAMSDVLHSVTKRSSDKSGVLCCRKQLSTCESCGADTGHSCLLEDISNPSISAITPSNGSTDGGYLVTIRGKNFGMSGRVRFGNRLCRHDLVGGFYSNSEIICDVPALQGGSIEVSVENDQSKISTVTLFFCNPPAIYTLTNEFDRFPTIGGSILTISGENFGDFSANVSVNGKTCAEISWAHSHSSIQCILPAGQGDSVPVVVQVYNQNSSEQFLRYDAPYISRVENQFGPTIGGIYISIYGGNFGVSGSVSIGGKSCNSSYQLWHHTMIKCILPSGEGAELDVVVSCGDQVSSSQGAHYTYAKPEIFSIHPESVSSESDSSLQITIFGTQFGISPNVFIGSVLVSNLISFNQSVIVLQLPSSFSGQRENVKVAAGNQNSSCLNSCMVSMRAPIITSITGCSNWTSIKGTFNCPIAGLIPITLHGLNFGANPEVFIQGNICSILNYSIRIVGTQELICNLPPNPSGQLHALVEINSGGQIGTSRSLSYSAPFFVNGSLRGCENEILSYSLKENLASAGGSAICFDLQDLLPDVVDSNISISYGFLDWRTADLDSLVHRTLPFNCSNPRRLNTSTISCITSKGTGKNLVLFIKVGSQSTWTYNETVSYISPALVNNSIRGPSGTRDSVYISRSSLGDIVSFDVLEFDVASIPSIWDDIRINYGQNDSEVLEYSCALLELVSEVPSGKTTVTCSAPAGEGQNLVFQIFALNGSSSRSSFVFSYPKVPEIHSVSSEACDVSGPFIENCPTEGNFELTIFGESFCDFTPGSNCSVMISVGQSFCTQPNYITNAKLTCILPSMTGKNLPISIFESSLGDFSWISTPKKLISFSSPSIISVSGCVNVGVTTTDCSRNTSSRITVEGHNFGAEVSTVLVNFELCENVEHASSSPHNILYCDAPPGGSLESVVSVIQAGGALSLNSGRLSYKQCLPGSYRVLNKLDCPNCAEGRYNPVEGSSFCLGCEPGRFSNVSGASLCSDCSPGTFSLVNSTQCRRCEEGKYSSFFGSFECSSCEPGRYSDEQGLSNCIACPSGTFTRQYGQTRCDNCSVGSYTIFGGSSACMLCSAGFYSNITGGTNCERCVIGFISPQAGSSTCASCRISTYSGIAGSSVCYSCPPGSVSQSSGASSCESCSVGRYDSLQGLSYCKTCARGRFSSFAGSKTCEICLPGSFNRFDASSFCELCSPGKFQSEAGQVDCVDCPIGTVSVSSGNSQCKKCGPGFIAPFSGMNSCEPCPPGFSAAPFGNTRECFSCSRGKFSDVEAKLECSSCPMGKYANQEGMSSCEPCPKGKYQSNPEASICLDCDPGRFTEGEGSLLCTFCSVGKFSAFNSSTNCDACGVGKYSSIVGSSACTDCPLGKSTGSLGSQTCDSCLVGRHANFSGQSSCDRCSRGYFQPLSEQQICLACPSGKFSFEESASCMNCPFRSVAPSPGLGSCIACPENSETDDEHTVCICKAGFFSIEKISTSGNQSTSYFECEECPLGADCDSPGARWETLQTREGWWRADRSSLQFYRCQLVDHCSGGLMSSCGGNREGVLCNRCKPGYEVVGTECKLCASASTSIAVFVVLVALIIAALVGMFYIVMKMDKIHLRRMKRQFELEALSSDSSNFYSEEEASAKNVEEPSIDGAPSPPPNFVYKLKIILGFFQICVAIALTLDIPWPNLYKSFIATFNVANFDIVQWTRFGCVVPITYLEKHLIVSIFPVAVVFSIALLYLFPKFLSYLSKSRVTNDISERNRLREGFRRGIRKFTKLNLFTIFLIYPTVSSVILKLYSCRTVEGSSYLSADFRVSCDSEEWKRSAKLNVFFTLMFPIAIPLTFAIILFTHRKVLHHPETLVQFGFLYAAYSEDTWWFEIVDVLYKLTLTSLLIFVPLDYRTSVGILIVLMYLIVFFVFRPYIRKGDDRLHGVVHTEILLMLLGGHVYREMGKIDYRMDFVLGVLFIMITVGIILLVCFQIFSLLWKMHRRKANIKHSEPLSKLDLKVREIRLDPRLTDVKFAKNPLSSVERLDSDENVEDTTDHSESGGDKDDSVPDSMDSEVAEDKAHVPPMHKISFKPEILMKNYSSK